MRAKLPGSSGTFIPGANKYSQGAGSVGIVVPVFPAPTCSAGLGRMTSPTARVASHFQISVL